jgi:hypothetical protein
MSRKSTEFDAFGVKYRTKQFPAIRGLELIDDSKNIHPCEILELTEAQDVQGNWHSLAHPDNINRYVRDVIEVLSPLLVLKAVADLVNEYSFGFLLSWKGVKIPARFTDSFRAVVTQNAQPLVSQLVQDKTADIRSLEEYYSLEDAFKMFDIMVAKGVNEALANEAASRDK